MRRYLTLVVAAALTASAVTAGHGRAADRKTPDAGPQAKADAGPAAGIEACLDQWATEHHLNTYGDPPDTVYAGGTPLFDETTGRRKERAAYIFAKHPDAKVRCAGK